MRTSIATTLALGLVAGCGGEGDVGFLELAPEHCRVPLIRSLPQAEASANEWWLPGPLAVGSTVDWPDCPPIDDSTADPETPRITFPAEGGSVADGSWPVVIFGHANSEWVCNPTDRYRSLHEQWASWGWIVYSVDASEQNCTKWTLAGMNTRVDKFDIALDDLRRRNADPRSPFHGKIRFDRVVAAGHSRGGAAAVALASRGEQWSGAMSLQGGSPPRFRLGDTYTDKPVIGISGQLDKDLAFPHVDLTESLLTGRYSWHTLRRGNHSFTADGLPIRHSDDPHEILPRVSQIELMKFLTVAYLASNFGVWDGNAFARQSQADKVLYSSFGDEFARAFLRGSGFISRWNLGPDHPTVWIDRFDSRAMVAPSGDDGTDGVVADAAVNDLGFSNNCDGLRRCEEVWTYSDIDDPETPPSGVRLASSLYLEAAERGGAFTTTTSRDVGEQWRLQARIRAATGGSAKFAIVVVGPDGERRVEGVDTVDTAGLADRFVQMDLPLNEGRVDAIRIELIKGALHVDDLRFVAPGP